GPTPSCVSQVDPPPSVEPLEISSESSGPAEGGDPAADDTAATRRSPRLETPPGFPPRPSSPPPQPAAMDSGADEGGDAGAGASGGAETGGDETGGAGTGGAETRGAETGAMGAPAGGPGVGQPQLPSRLETLSPQQIREWIVLRGRPGGGRYGVTASRAAGAGGATGARGVGAASPDGTAGARGAGGAAGAGCDGGAAGAGGTRGAGGAAGTGGARAGVTGDTGDADGTGIAPRQPFFYPQPQSSLPPLDSALRQTSLSHSYSLAPRCLLLLLTLRFTESLTESREPETRASTLVRACRVACSRPPAVPGTHVMTLRPSSVPHCIALLSPPASSLPNVPGPESDLARVVSPTATRLLATVITDPDFESTAEFALSESVYPPSVGGEPPLSSHVLEDRQFELECLATAFPCFASMLLCPEGDPDALDIPTPRSYVEALAGEYSSQWQTAMDAEMASWKSTCTYVNEVPPPGANKVDGMWILRVKRPPGSPPAFKTRYVARGFSQRQGVDFFQTFSPTPKMTTLRVLLHVATQHDYELNSLDFSTTFLQGSLHEEIWLSRPPGFTGSFLAGPSALRLPVLLATAHSSAYWPLALSSPLDESVEPSGPYPEFVGCFMYLMTCTRPDLAYPLSLLACYVAPGRHQKGYTFGLGSGSISWRSTCSSSVLGSNCEAEIYVGAMAAQELRWLAYLLTDLGVRPRSPPVLYVDDKAMIALCQEQRLEHKTKHIALR
ncbi:unnamed protein product, partial [Closterium sp. NIES-54]